MYNLQYYSTENGVKVVALVKKILSCLEITALSAPPEQRAHDYEITCSTMMAGGSNTRDLSCIPDGSKIPLNIALAA